MRLLKGQNTNLRNIYGKGVKYDVNDQVILDSTNVMLVPKGTQAQRPTSPVNGHLRYNTDIDNFEVYEGGAWVTIANTAPAGTGSNVPIVQQNLGNGDAVETLFGPLNNQDTAYPAPAGAQNILVFVENVFQISGTNYTIVQNPGQSSTIVSIDSIDGTTGFPTVTTSSAHGLETGDTVSISGVETNPDDNIELLNVGDDSTSPGSVAVTKITDTSLEIHVDVSGGVIGNYVTNSGVIYLVDADQATYLPGWYIEFTSAPDLDKPVTVLHNFDK